MKFKMDMIEINKFKVFFTIYDDVAVNVRYMLMWHITIANRQMFLSKKTEEHMLMVEEYNLCSSINR
jgi:general stress protein 26